MHDGTNDNTQSYCIEKHFIITSVPARILLRGGIKKQKTSTSNSL